MKSKNLKLVVSIILVMIASCDEPETVVTDVVHSDGSVTRKIEMRNFENKFEISDIQVPFDSTWTYRDSLEISGEKDTIWVRRAEKQFVSAGEINKSYETDSGANRDFQRRAEFRKKFKWFNTEYRFAEAYDKLAKFGYPLSEFLNSEELLWFYSHYDIKKTKEESPDSLKYKALNDSVDSKTDKWFVKSIASEWIGEFSVLIQGKAGEGLTYESLKTREDEMVRIVDSEQFDSLWSAGVLLKEFIGDADAVKYRTEADSAMEMVTGRFLSSFSDYTQRIVMPGKVIGTNGFIDSTGIMLWPVTSDYFITEPYEMWAESKIPNIWAWIVSGAFLVFVLSGIIFKSIKRG